MKLIDIMREDGITVSDLENYLDGHDTITAWQYACCKYYCFKYGEECRKVINK